MSEEINGAVEKAKKVVEPAVIIRGRMPVAVVAQVRFGKNSADGTKSLATLYGTTVGKVDDIKKNRNFAYVTEDFRPTAQQKADGIEWLKRHVDFEKGAVDAIILELETSPEATEEEAATFLSARTAARGQVEKTKTGEVADAGGGNRTKGKKAKKEKVETQVEPADGDDLLS